MSDVNITEVRLLNVPIESDYKITLWFPDKTSQENYFKGKVISNGVFTDLSYQRKDHFIRIPLHFDDAIKCNYVMYQNKAYSNKWFYAFVKDVKYVDDGRSDIYIETDCMQTWLGDYTVKPSFVEREHVSDDTIGIHTYPENLETGEYIAMDRDFVDLFSDYYLVIATTEKVSEMGSTSQTRPSGMTNGIYSALRYYVAKMDSLKSTQDIDYILHGFYGRDEAIATMFIAPAFLVEHLEDGTDDLPYDTFQNTGEIEIKCKYVSNKTMNAVERTVTQSRYTSLDGYVPRNNKLYVYPYSYLLVSNNAGGSAIYMYEKWSDPSSAAFKIFGVLTPGCSVTMIPVNYNGVDMNVDEGINLGKFPIVNWTSDIYTNWLTQNSINIGTDSMMAIGKVIGGLDMAIASGGSGALMGGGLMLNGVTSIMDIAGTNYQHSMMPDQAKGNLNCGDVSTAMGYNTYHFYQMCVKKEYAAIIDSIFDMYGYKVNRVKTPNVNRRKRYWYTKTVDVNIDGSIPNKDLQVIRNCYNNGITFWKYSDSNIGAYPDGKTSALNNPIV